VCENPDDIKMTCLSGVWYC